MKLSNLADDVNYYKQPVTRPAVIPDLIFLQKLVFPDRLSFFLQYRNFKREDIENIEFSQCI